MATEDDGLERFAEIQERQMKSRVADLSPTPTMDCDECGDPIPPLRKAAAPWAIRCIDCEELFQKRNKR